MARLTIEEPYYKTVAAKKKAKIEAIEAEQKKLVRLIDEMHNVYDECGDSSDPLMLARLIQKIFNAMMKQADINDKIIKML